MQSLADLNADQVVIATDGYTRGLLPELDAVVLTGVTGDHPPLGGIFGVTEDRLPLVGLVPGHEGLWVAAGYSGHGNVLGLTCGGLVAHAILGRKPAELELFDPARLLPA